MATAGTPLLLGLGPAVALIGNGAGGPIHAGMLHRRVGADRRTSLLSINSLAGQGGGMIGNIIMGTLAAYIGILSTWTIAAVILLIAAAIYLVVPSPNGPATRH